MTLVKFFLGNISTYYFCLVIIFDQLEFLREKFCICNFEIRRKESLFINLFLWCLQLLFRRWSLLIYTLIWLVLNLCSDILSRICEIVHFWNYLAIMVHMFAFWNLFCKIISILLQLVIWILHISMCLCKFFSLYFSQCHFILLMQWLNDDIILLVQMLIILIDILFNSDLVCLLLNNLLKWFILMISRHRYFIAITLNHMQISSYFSDLFEFINILINLILW